MVRVGIRQFLLVRARGLRDQLLQRQQVRPGGGQVAGGAGGVGVGGADVVAGHSEVGTRVGLVDELPAEEVHPHHDRQQQRGHRRGGAAPQRPGEQHRDAQAEPRQEGLHQAAEVPGPVRNLRVQQHEQAKQQRQRCEHQATPPGLRPGADQDRPADARAPAADAALSGLCPVHQRLSSHTVSHFRILGSWVGSAYMRGQP